MTQFYTDQQVGRTRELTPEGFLLCRDVPIAQCGELLYAEYELDGVEGKDGVIHVTRKPEDVFRPESVASFAGKPVIITHKGGQITPQNWKQFAVGTVMHPRRGEGDQANQLLADLLISDAEAIELVSKTTRHEVSAGYDAEYEQQGPGKARQFDIFGNHVALVERGRCGPRCAIGDSEMPTPRTKLNSGARRQITADAIRKAFTTRDEAMLEEALGDVEPEALSDNTPPSAMGAGDVGQQAHNITVNIHGASSGSNDAPSVMHDDGMGAPMPDGADPASGGDMPAWAHAIMARLDAIEASMGAGGGEDPGDEPLGDEPAAEAPPEDAPPEDDDADDDDAQPTKDGKMPMTMDSVSLRALHADTIARAEILAPGVRMMTLDSKSTVKQNFDNLCAFKRRVLSKAAADTKHADLIAPVLGGHDLRRMTCDSLGTVFTAASELVKAHNRSHTVIGMVNRQIGGGSPKAPPTAAEINAANRKLHGFA